MPSPRSTTARTTRRPLTPLPRQRGRPTTDQSEQIVDKLTQVALRSFIDRGFEGTTLDAIAKDANVARVTVYRRFGDKRELFRAVARLAQTTLSSRLRDNLPMDGPPEQVLRAMIGRLLDAYVNPEYLGIVKMAIFESNRFPEIARAYWSEIDHALQPITAYLQQLQGDGVISVENARDAALQFTTLAVGGIRYLLLQPKLTAAGRQRWIESVYTTFARAWGLDRSHLDRLYGPS